MVEGRFWKNRIGFSANSGEYEVTDELYIKWYWVVLLLASVLGVILVHSLQSILDLGMSGLTVLAFLGAVSLFAFVVCYRMIRYVGPLESFWLQMESWKMDPPTKLYVAMMVLMPATVVVDLSTSVLGIALIVGLTGYYWRYEDVFIGRSDFEKSTSMDYSGVRSVVTSYLVFLLSAIIPLLIFVGLSFIGSFYRLLTQNWLFLLTYLFCFSVMWPAIVFSNTRRHLRLELLRFDRDGPTSKGLVSRLLFGVTALILSTFFGILAVVFYWRVFALWSINEVVAISVVLLVGWPVLFVGAGLVYQFLQVASVSFWWVRGTQKDLGEGISSDVYVLGSEKSLAGAISIGWYDFIVVSEFLVEELDDEELEFVLAHEEGHIVHRDSHLAVLAGFVSALFLTGKNAVYALCDFESRELRADEYAVEKIGDADQAVRTLNSMKELEVATTAGDFQNTIPTVVSLRSDSLAERTLFSNIFQYYYGSFAVGTAHPSIDERKNRLE